MLATSKLVISHRQAQKAATSHVKQSFRTSVFFVMLQRCGKIVSVQAHQLFLCACHRRAFFSMTRENHLRNILCVLVATFTHPTLKACKMQHVKLCWLHWCLIQYCTHAQVLFWYIPPPLNPHLLLFLSLQFACFFNALSLRHPAISRLSKESASQNSLQTVCNKIIACHVLKGALGLLESNGG